MHLLIEFQLILKLFLTLLSHSCIDETYFSLKRTDLSLNDLTSVILAKRKMFSCNYFTVHTYHLITI